jgi:hypothetical protein
MAQVLGVVRFLALAKPFKGIWPIVIGEVLYQLINKNLCFQFHKTFLAHLSPH